LLIGIGDVAAEEYVEASHLPHAFDLKQMQTTLTEA